MSARAAQCAWSLFRSPKYRSISPILTSFLGIQFDTVLANTSETKFLWKILEITFVMIIVGRTYHQNTKTDFNPKS